MRGSKQSQQLAKQLFRISFADDGQISSERVGGVLQYIEKHAQEPRRVLETYRRLVTVEIARGQALVEHAGPVSDSVLRGIEATMTKRYGRRVVALARPNPALLAGLRVKVGDDVFESSAAGQLSALSLRA